MSVPLTNKNENGRWWPSWRSAFPGSLPAIGYFHSSTSQQHGVWLAETEPMNPCVLDASSGQHLLDAVGICPGK